MTRAKTFIEDARTNVRGAQGVTVDSHLPRHRRWREQVSGDVITYDLPGDWRTLFTEPAVSLIGQRLRACTE